MKKIFIGLLVCTFLTSCKKENPSEDHCHITELSSNILGYNQNINFSYDEDHRISKIISKMTNSDIERYDLTYTSTKIIAKKYLNDKLSITYNYYLNAKGLITEVSAEDWKYSVSYENGYIANTTDASGITTYYTWEDGNLKKIENKSSEPFTQIITYNPHNTYKEFTNYFLKVFTYGTPPLSYTALLETGYFGKLPKHEVAFKTSNVGKESIDYLLQSKDQLKSISYIGVDHSYYTSVSYDCN